MEYLLLLILVVSVFIIGLISFPFLLFLRARRSKEWDDSNITNIFRVLAHIAVRPADFGRMKYSNGIRPFWYISKDELSEVVKTNYKH